MRRPAAATLVGVLAGVVCAQLGKGGPVIVLKLAPPGIVVDLGARWGRESLTVAWWGAPGGAAGALIAARLRHHGLLPDA